MGRDRLIFSGSSKGKKEKGLNYSKRNEGRTSHQKVSIAANVMSRKTGKSQSLGMYSNIYQKCFKPTGLLSWA